MPDKKVAAVPKITHMNIDEVTSTATFARNSVLSATRDGVRTLACSVYHMPLGVYPALKEKIWSPARYRTCSKTKRN